MKRCRHRGNVTIYEDAMLTARWEFFESCLVEDFVSGPSPTGVIAAYCNDCGRLVRVGDAKRLPKWAKALWTSIREDSP
jgi:hypothetical protein